MDSASNPEELQFTSEEKAHKGDVPTKDVPYSNRSCQELFQTDHKVVSPIDVKSSSSRSSEAVPELCSIGQPELAKPTQDDPLNTTFPEKTLHITDNLSKVTSGEKGSVSTGKPIIKSVEYSYCKPFLAESESTGINQQYKETGSIGKIPVPLEISKSKTARKAPNSTSDIKLELNVLDDIINVSNTNEVLTVKSSASPLDLPNFEMDASLLGTENIKIPEFQHDGEKNTQEGNLGRFVFVSTKKPCVGHSIAIPSTLSKHTVATFDFPLVPSSLTSSTKESKPLHQDLKPSVHFSKNSKESLKDKFLILENWARRGLDNSFNRPVKFSSVNFGANFEKDLKFGLGVMKEMTTRIYALMRAANKLPDPGIITHHGFSRIHGDLIDSGITMWNTIDDIELHVSYDYKKLKLICNNVSEKSIEDMEEGPNPNILITNAYTLVTERLLLLRPQMESFLEKIRVFCSEIDKLL